MSKSVGAEKFPTNQESYWEESVDQFPGGLVQMSKSNNILAGLHVSVLSLSNQYDYFGWWAIFFLFFIFLWDWNQDGGPSKHWKGTTKNLSILIGSCEVNSNPKVCIFLISTSNYFNFFCWISITWTSHYPKLTFAGKF